MDKRVSGSTWMGVLAILVLLIVTSSADATFIDQGFNLIQTTPGTLIELGGVLVPFKGVPLGTFDFGGAVGVQPVPFTDSVVERLNPAAFPDGTTYIIPVQDRAFQLQSEIAVPVVVDGVFGPHFLFFTMHSGIPSTGTLTVHDNGTGVGGTLDFSFMLAFDLRADSLSGTIIGSGIAPYEGTNVPWSSIAPPEAETIEGVNNPQGLFFVGLDLVNAPGPHLLQPVPEPGSFGLLGMTVAVSLLWRRRVRRRIAQIGQ